MPDKPFVDPSNVYTDAQTTALVKESLQRAVLIRMDLLSKPKPTYNVDGQEFKWTEYLEILNATIKQLQLDLVTLDELYEFDSTLYT